MKRYFYYKGFKIKNKYYKEPHYIQKIHFNSIKNFIDVNFITLKSKFVKNKVVHTSTKVYDTNVLDLVQNSIYLDD